MRNGLKVLIVLALAASGRAQSIPREELTLRAAYAKLPLSIKISNIRAHLLEIPPVNRDSDMTVEIGGVRTGAISDILRAPVNSYTSDREGLVLKSMTDNWSVVTAQDRAASLVLDAEWQTVPADTSNRNSTVAQAIESVHGDYTRYATANVKIGYQGRQREYRTLFLFGNDASGNPSVFPGDNVVGIPAMDAIIKGSVTPRPFILRGMENDKDILELIRQERSSQTCEKDSATGMCCDPATWACGVGF